MLGAGGKHCASHRSLYRRGLFRGMAVGMPLVRMVIVRVVMPVRVAAVPHVDVCMGVMLALLIRGEARMRVRHRRQLTGYESQQREDRDATTEH